MQFVKRIGYFVLTNILVMVTVGIAWTILSNVLGFGAFTPYVPGLMVFCLVWGMGSALVSLLLSRFSAKRIFGVQVIEPNTPNLQLRTLVTTVHQLARKAGLPVMPEVGVYESDEVNAFATGRSKRSSLVAVSSGLLYKMDQQELEGVLGHEISHVANGDMVTMTLIQGVVNAFAMFFSRILANVIASNVEERLRGVVHFVVTILGDIAFTLLGSFVVNYFSRVREYRADSGSARLTSRENMVAALRRLQSLHQFPSRDEDLATLKINGQPKRGSLADLLMTHPPLEDRIRALEGRRRG